MVKREAVVQPSRVPLRRPSDKGGVLQSGRDVVAEETLRCHSYDCRPNLLSVPNGLIQGPIPPLVMHTASWTPHHLYVTSYCS